MARANRVRWWVGSAVLMLTSAGLVVWILQGVGDTPSPGAPTAARDSSTATEPRVLGDVANNTYGHPDTRGDDDGDTIGEPHGAGEEPDHAAPADSETSSSADERLLDSDSSDNSQSEAEPPVRRRVATDPDFIREYFRRDEWPIDNSIVCGFEFQKNHYLQLSDWSVEQDVTWPAMTHMALHVLPQENRGVLSRRNDIAAWNAETEDYDVGVIRALTLKHPEVDEELNMRIFVLPSPEVAADLVLMPYEAMSADYRGGAKISLDTNVSIGTVAIFRTYGFNWQPEDARGMALLRHNVIVTLSSVARDDEGRRTQPELEVLQLALDIDREIESQRVGAAGAPVRTAVSVELGKDSVRRPINGWGGRQPSWEDIDFLWSASLRSGSPTTFLLRAAQEPLREPETNQPIEGAYTYQVGRGLSVDDLKRPSKVTSGYALHAGYYHVGIIAWGPNLLPSVSFAPVQVIQEAGE